MHKHKRLALNLDSPTLTITLCFLSLWEFLSTFLILSAALIFCFGYLKPLFPQSFLLNSKKSSLIRHATLYPSKHIFCFCKFSQILLGNDLFIALCAWESEREKQREKQREERESSTFKTLLSSLCRCLVCGCVGVYVYEKYRNWKSSPSCSYNNNSTEQNAFSTVFIQHSSE